MPYKSYSTENLDQALVAVRNREMTAYKASKVHNVPYQTLLDKLKNMHTNPSGHATVLTKKEELIVKWIHHMAEIGFPFTKEQLLHSAGKLVKELSRPNPFKSGIPGRHWYEGFLKRNPNVSSRVCQALTIARVGAKEEKIRHWFCNVHNYLKENNYLDILQDPSRIFNCDESAFFLSPKNQAVLARKGQKSAYSRSGNDEKKNLPLSLGASANGKLMPILALFPYKRIPINILQKYPKTWVIGKYIANAFNGYLLKENIKKPILLFLDGHVSHLSLPLTTFCKENGIILVALLPNSTHVLQPMDIAVFHALKSSWKKSVHDWRMTNNAQKLRREDFGPILGECIQRTLQPEILINGFRRTGLFPFDLNAINYDKLLKSNQSSDVGSSTSDSRSTASTPFDDEKLIHERSLKELEKTSSCPTNSAQFLAEVEKLLGIEKLKLFKNCNGVWQGDIKDENLFYFWKKVKGLNDNIVEIGDSTLEPNNCTLNNIEENVILDWGNNNILKGIVENDGTVTFTPNLTFEESSRSPSKVSELIESEDDNIRSYNFNPVLNNTSTPTTKSKHEPKLFEAPVKPSQHENLTLPNQTLAVESPVKSFSLNCTTLPTQQQSSDTNNNILPRANESSLSNDSQAEKSVTGSIPNFLRKQILMAITLLVTQRNQSSQLLSKTLFYGQKQISLKKAKKNVKKALIPTIATSTEYMDYQRRLDQEKKQKIEKAELRKKEREEKATAKLTAKAESNKNKDTDSETSKKEKGKRKSKKTRLSEAAQLLESENFTEKIKDNKTPNKEISFKTGEYVVIAYEGENFPGLITKVFEGASKAYDVKTMTMSGLDTITDRVNWRWPEKGDILTYDCEDIVKKIKAPKPLNKRGVYSAVDM